LALGAYERDRLMQQQKYRDCHRVILNMQRLCSFGLAYPKRRQEYNVTYQGKKRLWKILLHSKEDKNSRQQNQQNLDFKLYQCYEIKLKYEKPWFLIFELHLQAL